MDGIDTQSSDLSTGSAVSEPKKSLAEIAESLMSSSPGDVPGNAADSGADAEPVGEAVDAKEDSAVVDAGSEEPAKAEPPVVPRVELALAKALRELKAERAELARIRESSGSIDTLKADFSKNPLLALEKITGRPIKEIFEAAARGDYDVRDNIPEDVKKKLEWVEQFQAKEAEREKEEAKSKEAAKRAKEREVAIPRMKAMIESQAEKYQYLSATEIGAESAVDEIYDMMDRGEEVDVPAVLAAADERAKLIAGFWVRQAGIISKLVKSDASIRKVLQEALGEPSRSDQVAPGKLPSSVASMTEVQDRKDPKRNVVLEIAEEWKRIRKG